MRAAKQATFLTLGFFALSACEEGLNLGASETDAEQASAPTAKGGVADVKRPDIFSTRELALWDGRPSLGGIWVAHPDVTEPERAILTNESNGQSIAGALFRRERGSPGPKLQLSSDAAAALNVLAGQPTELSVVVVRQEEIEIEETPPVISDETPGEETTSEDTDGDGDAATAAGAAAAGAAAAETKPRGNFLERLFGRRKPAQAPLGDEGAPAGDPTADSAGAPTVETQTLDPVTTGAAAAIARAEADDKPQPRPSLANASSELNNPFVQVGLFSVEENAANASLALREAGIVPTVLQGDRDGTPFWRVVVGPVTSADEQAAVLGQVRQLGYGDAFLSPN
ncbi:MAG: SPOR domain-containing protein [Paracoccaceae bacterium]|nr:SPOR domain-containing protein [Paracoccaceae bacterium]